ncbi:MAG: ABC transporter ATP-binding protein [bacterium]|nr:ABC transporter ATP-binding protein [bacterium]
MNEIVDPHEDELKILLSKYGNDVEAATAALRSAADKPRIKKSVVIDGPVLIKATNLSKDYKVGKQQISALRNVNLEIRQGEFVAFTGPSGSGKSTLLQLIGGLDKPSEGTVIVDGQDLKKLGDSALSVFRNKTIGFVFQFFYLQPFLKLQTNLEVPAMFARTKPSEREAVAQKLAEAVGLSDRLHHLPKELSGGQMQRAAIARALLNKPKVILADEPTGNLDSTNGQAIIDLFEQVRKDFGTTIIVVTHDKNIADRADREIALKDGVIV